MTRSWSGRVMAYIEDTDERPRQSIAVCGVMLLVVGILDFMTGKQMSFFIFYSLPIGLMTWARGRMAGAAAALVCVVVWMIAQIGGPDVAPGQFVFFWNGGIRLVFFFFVVFMQSAYKDSLERESRLARTDSLTGIENTQSLLERVRDEYARAVRSKRPLSLAYVDCDNFKHVNDTMGHEAGNQLLKALAEIMRSSIRVTDRVGRIGGDEFVVLLPETAAAQAKTVVRRLQSAVLAKMDGGGWLVTLSIGLATFSVMPEDPDMILKKADELMYRSKRTGKNKITAESIDSSSSLALRDSQALRKRRESG